MAAKKKTTNPLARFVVYVFTSIVTPIIVAVGASSVKESKAEATPHALVVAPAPAVVLLPPTPEPSTWEAHYQPTTQTQLTTTTRRHDEKK